MRRLLLALLLLTSTSVFAESERKLHRSALAEASSFRAFARLTISFEDEVSLDEARAAIDRLGGQLDEALVLQFERPRRLRARMPSEAIHALARDPRVRVIHGPAPRAGIGNLDAAEVSAVDAVQQIPYGLTGAGVTLSFFELAAADTRHPEFGGRLTTELAGGSRGERAHATHVAGTMIASGLTARARGMAPAARLFQFDASGSETSWLRRKENALAPLGVVADNNSWGFILGWCYSRCGGTTGWVWTGNHELFGAYDYVDPALDSIARDSATLFIHSAGNEANILGPGSAPYAHEHTDEEDASTISGVIWCYSQDGSGTDCPSQCATRCEKTRHPPNGPAGSIGLMASAKNVLSVGAIDQYGAIASFSGRGPTRDGRLKPEVVAKGVFTYSTSVDGGYEVQSGTSMATPVVTGVAALVVEQWRKSMGRDPQAIELKATLIAGSHDLGPAGPDYTYGFGVVNAKSAADLVIADRGVGDRIRTGELRDDASVEIPFALRQPQDVRIVLAWHDPEVVLLPEQIDASVLVNDLDVKVIAPDGRELLPYVLDKRQPQALATPGVNTLDNTEMVELYGAPAGVYRIVITGSRIAEGTQPFAVVANVPLGTTEVPPTPPRRRIAR